MRSFNNILSDIHAGKEVDNQELKMALLLAENNIDIGKCLDSHYDRKRLEDEICKNRNQRNLHKQIEIKKALEVNKII